MKKKMVIEENQDFTKYEIEQMLADEVSSFHSRELSSETKKELQEDGYR